MVDLSKTSIDFEDLIAELEADLQSKDSFQALFPGETSKIFTEHGAGITALMLYHIHSATQNAFFPTAFSKQAVYALATSLGNPPRRKLGAQLTVRITVNIPLAASVTLPKFSRFSGRSLEWYTIEDNIIPIGAAGQTLDITLRQGERTTDTFTGSGNQNQRLEIGEDFDIDENFLIVTVDGNLFTKNGSSLLSAGPGDQVYAEQTTSNGRVLVLFGNNILGSIPNLGDSIEISYANTTGVSSNSSITGDDFLYLDLFDIGGGTFLDLSGVSLTTASGGSDEETVTQVKNTAPKLFAANQRAVSRDDYIGHLLNFTGAISARAWGEYEEATQKGYADLTMMNRAYVTVIPPILNDQSSIIATGDGIILSFTPNIGGTLLPGSIIISSDTSDWRDYDGKGLLTSPQIDFNEISGAGPANASENPGSALNGWDNTPGTSWSSVTTPTNVNPIRTSYDFGAGNEKQIRSLRIQSTQDTNINSRGFPKQILILGSNLVSPDPAVRGDWEVLRGNTLLEEPGYNGYSRWVSVDDPSNTTAYRHVGIEILDKHGNGLETKIASVSVQDESNESTIDYDTGDLVLNYQSAPTGDITAEFYNGNFTSSQKNDILTYLNDLNHFTTLINYRNSIAVPIDVVADVYHLEGFEAPTVLSNVQQAIIDLFTIQPSTINKPIYLSDLYQAIQDVNGVDYSVIQTPILDIFTEIDQFVLLNSQTISIFPTDR